VRKHAHLASRWECVEATSRSLMGNADQGGSLNLARLELRNGAHLNTVDKWECANRHDCSSVDTPLN
jgi:hypothetical protein